MAYSKIYTRINWVNKQVSKTTPVGAIRLNQIDGAIDTLDDRIIEQETLKLDKATALTMVADWSMDEETGIITITKLNGEKIIFDLNIEKIPVNFELSEDGILTMTTDDGTEFTANIGDMIPVLSFVDSDEITVSVTGEGKNKTYSFSIKAGSVTEDKLQPNFLAEIKVESASAQLSAEAAAASEANAKAYEQSAAESAENAKSYAEQAKEVSAVEIATTESAGIVKPDGDTISLEEDGTIKVSLPSASENKDGLMTAEDKLLLSNKRIFFAVGDNSSAVNTAVATIPELDSVQEGDLFVLKMASRSGGGPHYVSVIDGNGTEIKAECLVRNNYDTFYTSTSPMWFANDTYIFCYKSSNGYIQMNYTRAISDSVTSTSSTTAASSYAAKQAYDKGVAALVRANEALKLVGSGIIDAWEATETESVYLNYEQPVILVIWGYVSTETYCGKFYGYGAYLRILHSYQTSADSDSADQIGGLTLAQSTNIPYTLSNDTKNRCVNIKATKGYQVWYSVYEMC